MKTRPESANRLISLAILFCLPTLVAAQENDSQVAWLANQNMNLLVGGKSPERMGTAHPNLVPYQAFKTASGSLMLAASLVLILVLPPRPRGDALRLRADEDAPFQRPVEGEVIVDHLFRYEALDEAVAYLEARLGHVLTLPHRNSSPRRALDLSPDLEARLRREAAADFDLWASLAT